MRQEESREGLEQRAKREEDGPWELGEASGIHTVWTGSQESQPSKGARSASLCIICSACCRVKSDMKEVSPDAGRPVGGFSQEYRTKERVTWMKVMAVKVKKGWAGHSDDMQLNLDK